MDIGTAASQSLERLMGSQQPSARLEVEKPASLKPKTREDCRDIERWIQFGANEPIPTVTRAQLTRHLEFLAAALPSKNVDEAAGRDRAAVYFRMLGSYSDAAIAYMSKRAISELDWFPTLHQCMDILGQYQHPTSDRQSARMSCQAFLQAEMEAFVALLAAGVVDQSIIDQQPEQWKRIAENRGFLRWQEGTFVQRLKAITAAQTDQAQAA